MSEVMNRIAVAMSGGVTRLAGSGSVYGLVAQVEALPRKGAL